MLNLVIPFKTLVAYHLQIVLENTVGKRIKHDFLGRSIDEKFRSNGKSDKVVPFSRTGWSKRKFLFLFFKAVFYTSFRPLRPFLGNVNGTDL